MRTAQLKARLRELANKMIDDGGVSAMSLAVEFKTITDPEELMSLGQEAFDDLIKRWAADIVNDLRRVRNGQLVLEGIGEVDETVTTVDGEGGFVVKHLHHATVADLIMDVELHQENVNTAQRALLRAKDRNRALIPLMESNGYTTVGEVLSSLAAQSDDDRS